MHFHGLTTGSIFTTFEAVCLNRNREFKIAKHRLKVDGRAPAYSVGLFTSAVCLKLVLIWLKKSLLLETDVDCKCKRTRSAYSDQLLTGLCWVFIVLIPC